MSLGSRVANLGLRLPCGQAFWRLETFDGCFSTARTSGVGLASLSGVLGCGIYSLHHVTK